MVLAASTFAETVPFYSFAWANAGTINIPAAKKIDIILLKEFMDTPLRGDSSAGEGPTLGCAVSLCNWTSGAKEVKWR
jgi:hypothetical protein